MSIVVFVGPLPPPVHGFSNVCQSMLDLLKKHVQVEVFDRAARSPGRIWSAFRQCFASLRFLGLCLEQPNITLYLALSGGLGQFVDFVYLLFLRTARHRLFIHHHSFAYLDSPSILNRLLFKMARGATHIALSGNMADALREKYDLDADKVKVLSNAAFLSLAVIPRTINRKGPIRLGFLSNISFEKGIAEFFEVLKILATTGVDYKAYVAGPVTPNVESAFSKWLASSFNTEYLGPRYGEAKERFYQEIDILLFPTKYANEAEPLVIHEATRSGVHVISCNRGAIEEILANGAGIVCSAEQFSERAARYIRELSENRAALEQAQMLSLRQAIHLRADATISLETVLKDITGLPQKEHLI